GYVHRDPSVRRAWDASYQTKGDGPQGICLVTGQPGPVESVHPAIKNVAGAQSSGAALVSFNAPAFCSYGKEQNLNAPTGKYAAFAYTSALNALLADREHVFRVGDATVVCWARSGERGYQDVFQTFFSDFYDETDLKGLVGALCQGNPVVYDETKLDPSMDFYILGLSPNSARLSVRFFLHNTFGGFLRNVQAHYDRLEIVRPAYDKFETLPLWKLLSETVNQNARDKSPAPDLAGEVLRAVLTNTRYPATLLNGAALRIRAEREVTRG
ncbi:nucleoside triphosphate pyrophosphohydrolase, partial [Dysosmobacter welbionis]